jgi:hypothetical protein
VLTQIEKSIIKTLAYFDAFDFPLTKEELWQNLWIDEISEYHPNDAMFNDFNRALDRLQPKTLAASEGFFSTDKKNIHEKIEKRKNNYRVSIKKNRIALKNTKILSRLPNIKAIFLCNNLAYRNASPESDIDFFIIAKKGRIFSAKFFASSLLKLAGRRPNKKNAKNKICLSFWIDESRTRLGDLLYKDDIYFHYWFKQLVPIFDPENFSEQLWRDNSWLKVNLPNARPFLSSQNIPAKKFTSTLRKITDFFCGKTLEPIFRWLQLEIIPKHTKLKAAEPNSDVVINKDIIKLHTNDRRLHYKKIWQEKYSEIYEQN